MESFCARIPNLKDCEERLLKENNAVKSTAAVRNTDELIDQN